MENEHPLDLQVAELQINAVDAYRHWHMHNWARFAKLPPPLLRFKIWLAQTAIYCTEMANPADKLRSRDLHPPFFPENRYESIATVHRQRDWFFHGYPKPIRLPYELMSQGRLLAYYPGQNLGDGAAQDASDGFFDVQNIPPWDTWVDYFEKPLPGRDQSKAEYLVSWVPPQYIPAASEGIRVNPEGCIEWLEESETPFKTIWAEVKTTSWQ